VEKPRIARGRRSKRAAASPTVVANGALALTFEELDALVAENGERHRDRLEEWRWYLDYLREQAGPRGPIPREYRLLVRLVYGELPQVAAL
jgi:hypothetical protein